MAFMSLMFAALNAYLLYSYTESTKNSSLKMLSLGISRSMMQRSSKLALIGMTNDTLIQQIDTTMQSFFDHKSAVYFSSPRVSNKVSAMKQEWGAIKEAMTRYRRNPSAENRAVLLASSERYSETADAAFFALHDNAEAKRIRLFVILGGIIFNCALIMIIIMYTKTAVRDQLEHFAYADPLTGAYNRRSLELFTTQAHETYLRAGIPYAITLIDIDRFKVLNDKYGHKTGDAVLQGIAHQIRNTTRKQDIFARIGGDEFIILQSHVTGIEAHKQAQRVLAAVDRKRYSGKKLRVTITIGTAEVKKKESVKKVIARADRALYRAKRGGRNKAVFL